MYERWMFISNIKMLVYAITSHLMLSFSDGFGGYNQIKMHPWNIEKTSFRISKDNFSLYHHDFWS